MVFRSRALVFGILVLTFLSIVSANDDLLKVTLSKGDNSARSTTITSLRGGIFNLSSNLAGTSFGENSFVLSKGESKTFRVLFNSSNVDEGIHIGQVYVTSSSESFVVPVAFVVKSQDVFFDGILNIPPNYKLIKKGSSLVSQLDILDLTYGGDFRGLGESNVSLEYSIYSLDGKMVYSKFESLSVNGRMEISENILIDNKFQSGDYIMFVKIIKGNSIGISSDEFSVVGFVSIKGISSSLSDIFSKDNMVLLIFILLVFLVLIGLIVYLIRERDLIAGWSRYYLTGSRLKRDVREQKDDEFSTLRHKIGHNKINKYLK